MPTKTTFAFAAVCCSAAFLSSQSPALRMDPALVPGLGGVLATHDVTATPGALFGVMVDLAGGPRDLFGERFYLGLSPSMLLLSSGVVPGGGVAARAIGIPLFPGLAGTVVYGQALVLDPAAPNGLFKTSNAASTAVHVGPGAIVATFDNPLAAGYTGTFAADVVGQLRGGPITTRTHVTIDPQGVVFPYGIRSPLDPNGCREQMVYRAQDLGASGEPELITAIRWRHDPNQAVFADTFPQFQLRLGHTAVVPDYSIDPFSALPAFPDSGLATNFAANELPGAPPQLVYQGAYWVSPTSLLPGGFLPLPMAATFAYDGVSSLLVEFRVPPSQAVGSNGCQVRLMSQTSPQPNARLVARGSPGAPLDPNTASFGIGDNAMAELQIVFARVETFALSPWLASGVPAPDYDAPLLAQSLPTGTALEVRYRGAATSTGTSPTSWSPTPDVADGLPFLQFRVVFRANLQTGELPLLDTLVVPLH